MNQHLTEVNKGPYLIIIIIIIIIIIFIIIIIILLDLISLDYIGVDIFFRVYIQSHLKLILLFLNNIS